MNRIDVDGSLHFWFSSAWTALQWDGSDEQRARSSDHHKVVDLVAAGPVALIVEVKDDRIKTRGAALKRAKAVRSGRFLADIAGKFRHSLQDVLGVASNPGARALFHTFATRWKDGRRRLVFWWEIPRTGPLGVSRDDRLGAYLSPLQKSLEKLVRSLTPRVVIANQRCLANTSEIMTVKDIKRGVGGRRANVRAGEGGRTRPPPKAPGRRKP